MTDEAVEAALREKFDARTPERVPGQCWRWLGSIGSGGYGCLYHKRKRYFAHRVSLMLVGRDMPQGLVVDHICRTRDCVNPDHLRVVTMRTNAIENSVSFAATNALKTHCKRGHELTPENVLLLKKQSKIERACILCRRLNNLKYYYKHHAERRAAENARRGYKVGAAHG